MMKPAALALLLCVPSAGGILPPDRLTTWNPGVLGGVPQRTTVYTTLNAATYGNGSQNATAGIQAALNACPVGQVVQLSAGRFTINGGNFLLINRGITLRGSGTGQTILQKTDGAKPDTEATGPNPSPIVIVGPARWSNNGGSSVNLSADAAKSATSVSVASAAGFSAGQIVLLDELSGASWQTDPVGRGQIWASPDFRVVWQRHNPSQPYDDPFPSAFDWFMRYDRPTSEIKQIDHVSGNTVFFTTPVHISYRVSHTAQLSTFGYAHTRNAGIEDLTVIGGDQGNIRFQWAAECWAKNVENTVWHDEGFAIDNCFRVEVRDSYVHDAAWPEPGGGGYAISLSEGSSEALIENCIVIKANKVMVARASGAASVFGYNYVDDGYIFTNKNWIECGLNASHMVGPHHVLFEGNYGFNWDSDNTHGNSIYHTVFRNHLRGIRRDFGDATSSGNGPKRCAGAMTYSYWHSFVGNVLGAPGQMGGWTYQTGDMGQDAIFLLGWDASSPYPVDAKVAATALRHGNYDYLSNTVKWDPTIADHALPDSLYLTAKPAFFGSDPWPWVDPSGPTQLYTLPAKARYEALIAPPSLPTVTLTATDASAGEPSDAGQVTFTRSGSTAAALTVVYGLGGTATNGVDYQTLGTSVVIPAGMSFATVPVTVKSDSVTEGSETVVFTIASSASYGIGSPSTATVTIAEAGAAVPPVQSSSGGGGGGGGGCGATGWEALLIFGLLARVRRAVDFRKIRP